LLCGTGEYSVADLRAHHIANGSSPEFLRVLDWFWTAVSNFTQEEMARLLQFTTGCSQLPPGGFQQLSPRFQITAAPTFANLPTAHTWYVLVREHIIETISALSSSISCFSASINSAYPITNVTITLNEHYCWRSARVPKVSAWSNQGILGSTKFLISFSRKPLKLDQPRIHLSFDSKNHILSEIETISSLTVTSYPWEERVTSSHVLICRRLEFLELYLFFPFYAGDYQE